MDTVYLVIVRDTQSSWSSIESIHKTPEGAEEGRAHRGMIWEDAGGKYRVFVEELYLSD